MQLRLLKYDVKTIWQAVSGDVNLDPLCNGWTAVNRGTITCEVNGQTIRPAPSPTGSPEAIGVVGNYGEVFTGRVNIIFNPADAAPSVQFTQKYYLPGQNIEQP